MFSIEIYKYTFYNIDIHVLTPKKPAEIFSYICHFIFAIIIATSYDTAKQIFINPEKMIFADFDSIILSLELLLAYVTIISGWVGYSRSMIKWPHTNTKLGAFRFTLDLAILFCYFGLISSIDIQNEFRDYFLYWISALFILFILWDIIKTREHYNKKNNQKFNIALENSFLKTVTFLTIFILIIPFIFQLWLQNQIGIITDQVIYGIILIITILCMLFYRYWKWSMPPHKQKNSSSKKKVPKP